MNTRIGWVALAGISLWLTACDPKTPVQTSDINTQVDQKIAAHNADSAAHAGLPIHVSQLVEGIGSGQITDGSITSSDIADATITSTQIADGGITPTKLAGGAVTAQAIGANAVQTAAIGDLMVTGVKIANGSVTTTQIAAGANIAGTQLAAGANIAGSQLAAGANITGSQLAAAANIAGSQLAAAANIAGTQLAANANITGAQLAAGANIAGTQLAAAAGIVGTQLTAGTLTSTQIAQGAIDDTRVNLSVNGTGNQTANTTFYAMNTDAAWTNGTVVTLTFSCSSTANDGVIQVFDAAAAIAGTNVTCDGFLKKVTFTANKNKTYNLKYIAAAAASPVTWRSVNVSW